MHLTARNRYFLKRGLLGLLFLFVIGGEIFIIYGQNIQASQIQQATDSRQLAFIKTIDAYKQLNEKIKDAQAKGIDVTEPVKGRDTARTQIVEGNLTAAQETIASAITLLDKLLSDKQSSEDAAKRAAEEAEKQKGTVTGKVTETSPIEGAKVTLLSGSTTVASTTTNKDGNYSLTAAAAKYTLSVAKSGYATARKTITITAQQTLTQDVTLSKATPAPTTSSSGGSSTSYSHYERKTISTSRGTFTIDLMTIDLGSGHVRMVTDTASDNDCSDNCPVKSLQSYVSQNGGFAGINGTYFCPQDYAACSGKVNTFYWKVYNSRLNKIINENNGLGEQDPAITFYNSVGRYFSHWNDAKNTSMSAGINSKPALVNNGQNVLNTNELDEKQKTTKSNRGALGLKGQTIYGVIAKSATVIDLAEIMRSLEVDSAMNIDGGGSSAMYYNGGYKVGPGRNLPNAVIFVEQ